jgi:hypothetical protein
MQRMIEATTLRNKSGETVHPERVSWQETPAGRVALFLFPRSALKPEDKDVAFATALGPMVIQAKFAPKDMLARGEPAL